MKCMHYVQSHSVTMGSYTIVDHFFVVDIPDTNVILGVQWLITLGEVTIDWEALKMEWVDKKSGAIQIIKFMHTYPSHNTSTQKTEMDLRSGSKDLIFPSLMFMRMLQGTFIPHGKPLGMSLDPDLVGKASQSAAPKIDQARVGEQATVEPLVKLRGGGESV